MQPRITTHTDLEALAEGMVGRLDRRRANPFARDLIVVPSHGMRRWLTLQLADRLGIAASVDMPLPATFVRSLANAVHGPAGDSARLTDGDAFLWRIYRLLGNLDDSWDETFAPLLRYLSGDDPGHQRRLQLAERIAARFDDYLLRRLDVLTAWENGKQPVDSPHAGWQAYLWRTLVREARPTGQLGLFDQPVGAGRLAGLPDALRRGDFRPGDLPDSCQVFATSALQPFFLETLDALAQHVDVDLWVLVPTLHDWRDVAAPRGDEAGFGNPLLARFGHAARPLFSDLAERQERGETAFDDPAPSLDEPELAEGTLLQLLQHDVRHVIHRGEDAPPVPKIADHSSLQLHDCFSMTRELETARTAILQAFDELDDLRPEDVVVLLPDVAGYAPFVQAVFGNREASARTEDGDSVDIPFRIADRGVGAASGLTPTFRRLLELVDGRMTASELLELLENDSVSRSFGLTRSDLPILHRRVADAGIAWGSDGAWRASRLDVPEFEAGTWRLGLDRLLAGYAFGAPPGDDQLEATVTTLPNPLPPIGGATDSDAERIGSFCSFVDTVTNLCRRLEADRPLDEHAAELERALDQLFEPDTEDDAAALTKLRSACARLRELASLAELSAPVPFAAVRAHLEAALLDGARGSDFMTGGITFCSLRPLRTVPFRVVCMLGMNDVTFPRRPTALPFDLVARARRHGDVAPRDEDEFLFLETLLSTRDRLIITWIGRSAKDLTECAPSNCVQQLITTIRESVTEASDPVVRHPLNAFSARYFDGSDVRLSSFSETNLNGALAVREPRDPTPFFAGPAAVVAEQESTAEADAKTDDETPLEVALDDLVRFWHNPSRYLLRNVMDVEVEQRRIALPDTEVIDPDGLMEFSSRQRLVELVDAELPDPLIARTLEASGLLRIGSLGIAHRDALAGSLRGFLARRVQAEERPDASLGIDGPGFRIVGELRELTADGRLTERPSRTAAKHQLDTWIRHLALLASIDSGAIEGVARHSIHVGLDKSVGFAAVDDPLRLLADLIGGYAAVTQAHAPIAFFPAASAKRVKMENSRGHDELDANERLAWRDLDHEADSSGLQSWAERILLPLVHARVEVSS